MPVKAAELGLNAHQSAGVGLDVSRDANVKWVRVDLNWPDAQPNGNAPDWTLFDRVVDGARARNLSVLAILAYTPMWASTGDAKGDGPTNDIPDSGKWSAYVSAAVQHFSGRVSYFEIWNEPNLAQFFEGTPQQYIDVILKPGADAVHAGGGFVVGPALATVGTQYAMWMDAVLTQAKDKLDVLSGHDYAHFTEDDSGAGTTSDSFFNKLDQHRLIQVGGATIYEGPLSFKEVMDAHSATQPFWLTETGIEAAAGDATAEMAQATYYQRVIDAMGARPWWPVTIFYEAFDEPPAPYHFGVTVDVDGGYLAKPAFDVLKKGVSSPDLAIEVNDLSVATDLSATTDLSANDLTMTADLARAQPEKKSASGCDAGANAPMGMWPLLLLLLLRFGHEDADPHRRG